MGLEAGNDVDTAVLDAGEVQADGGFDTAGAVESIAEGLGLGGAAGDEGDDAPDEPVAAAPAPAAAKPAAEPPAADPTKPAAEGLTPPKTWRPEAASKWATVDPTVQAEIIKREEDVFRGISQYKQAADSWQNVQRAISPYMPAMQQHGIEPVAHIATLMNAHQTLALGTAEAKEAMFLQLAQDYGVDLARLDPANRPYEDPQVIALRQNVQRLESQLNGITTQTAQSKQAEIASQVEGFAADPANEHFADVFEDMAVLLQGSSKLTLKEAYDKAVWANPVTRGKELARLETERTAEAARKAEEAKAAAAVKAAAVRKATGANVRSIPKSGSAALPVGTMEDTLTSTLREIESRTGR